MPRSVRARSRATSRRSAIAAVLCVGGVCLLLAGWKLEDGQPAQQGRWLALAAAVAVLAVAAARRLPSGLLPRRATMVATLFAVGVTLAATGFLALDAVRSFHSGFPSVAANLGVLGGLAVLLGLLVSLMVRQPGRSPAGGRRWRRSSRRSALVAGAVAAVPLAASAVAITSTSDQWAMRTRTVSAKEVPAVPATVSKVGWTLELPSAPRDVARAGAGAVVLVGDGVLGIDGARGAVRWEHRRLGSSASWLAASPDGGTVAVALNPPHGRSADQIVILDAMTGRLRARLTDGTVRASSAETLAAAGTGPAAGRAWLTDDVLVVPSTDGLAFRAYRVSDGRLAWSWLPPVGCQLDRRAGVGVLPHEVLAVPACPQTEAGPAHARLIRLDAVTGAVRGEQRIPLEVTGEGPTIDVAPDHALVAWRAPGAPEGQRLRLLEPATGELRPSPVEVRPLLPRGLATNGDAQPEAGEELVDARTGERRGRGVVVNCVQAGLLLENAALCGRVLSSPRAVADVSGRLELAVVGFGGQPAVEVPIEFGRRAATPAAGSTRYVAAHGAVLVYLRAPAVTGGAEIIVGLQ